MLSQLNAEVVRSRSIEIAAAADRHRQHELPVRERPVARQRESRVRATFIRLRLTRPAVRPI